MSGDRYKIANQQQTYFLTHFIHLVFQMNKMG
jgi:hypothetical protein